MAIKIMFGTYTVCEDGSRSVSGSPVGPIDGKGDLTPGSEDREYIGAAGIVPEHVGCDRQSLSFSVSRVYDSPGAAFSALAAMLKPPTSANLLAGAVPREGALTLVDGQTSSTIMANAVLRSIGHVQVGCALALRYTFEGF